MASNRAGHRANHQANKLFLKYFGKTLADCQSRPVEYGLVQQL